jgi:hypothetical protein
MNPTRLCIDFSNIDDFMAALKPSEALQVARVMPALKPYAASQVARKEENLLDMAFKVADPDPAAFSLLVRVAKEEDSLLNKIPNDVLSHTTKKYFEKNPRSLTDALNKYLM